MALKDKIENNLGIAICSFLVAGFLAGVGTFQWVLNVSGLEVAKKTTLCQKGSLKLSVDSFPKGSVTRVIGHDAPFYQGICLKEGRYQLETFATGYVPKTHMIQLEGADYISVVNLEPIQTISLMGTELKKYSGEKLSLSFDGIKVESALELMADFTENTFIFNNVEGRFNLRLDSVPWDQALDVILLTNSLSLKEVEPKVYVISGKEKGISG